jgi:hypothetical protein
MYHISYQTLTLILNRVPKRKLTSIGPPMVLKFKQTLKLVQETYQIYLE